MKKLNVLFATFMVISSFALADSNTVASANVLGYTKIIDPASNKMALVAAPFNCGTGTVSSLGDIFGTNQLRQSFLSSRCDQIFTWDVVQQSYVRYVQKTNGFFYFYTNFSGAAVNPVISRGQALWIKAPATAYAPTERTILISGNVPNDSAYTNSITGNSGNPMNFIANPYPVEVEVSSLINTNDGARGHFLSSKTDRIMLWDSEAQQYVYLSLKTPTNRWYYYTNWSASSAPVINIRPGQGFWYRTTNAFTWVENKSYVLE